MNAFTLRALLFAAALFIPALGEARDPVFVRLIGINDLHGNLEATGLTLTLADPAAPPDAPQMRVQTGGAPALVGMVKALRAGAPHSIVVGAGDLIGASPLVSALFKHESTIEILNDMGLEVSSLGNHEFDAGWKELQRLIKGGCAATVPGDVTASCARSPYRGAQFRYIAANAVDEGGRPIVAPYVVKRFGAIPVGFIGGVTKTTPQMVTPSGVAGLRFQDEAEAMNRAADELRAQGVKAMVVLIHEGFELGKADRRGDWNDLTCPEAHGPLLNISKRLAPEIKVIFSGHSHQGYRCELDGRLVIQGTSYGRGVSVVDVLLDPRTQELTTIRSANIAVANERTDAAQREKLAAALPDPFAVVLREAKPDARTAERVAAYAALVAPKAERPVGTIGGAFARGGKVDSAAGRLIADAQLAATARDGAQVAFMNQGGIRANLDCAAPPCTVTYGQAFTMQPFGNSLVVMSLSGAQLKDILEAQQRGASGDPVWLQPSEGFTYTWQGDAPRGERVRDMRLAGEPLRLDATYRVTVNSFLAEGGDGFGALANGSSRTGGGQDIDALIAYLSAATRTPIREPRVKRLP